MDLSKLPSPFYRGTIKAIILDDKGRLLIGRGEEDGPGWEIPGGGFEHGETMPECLRRELREELGAEVGEVGPVLFIYRGQSVRGWMILRVAVSVKLKNYDFKFGDMTDAKFVTKDEFLTTDFAADEGTVKEFAESIWPTR
jgi:ADP-ribose pyrophosphatase YjhB (NUDIX family)